MTIYFVGAGPGDPELITVKAQKILLQTDCCIWAGSLVNPELLKLLSEGARVLDSAIMNLDEIVSVMVHEHRAGKTVARLHTGDPALYGAIGEQMDRLREQNISFEIIPGVSAFQGAAASLQIELTRPELSQSVVLTRTEGRTPMPRLEQLESFAATGATLCLYLSVNQIEKVVQRVLPAYGEDCPAAVVFKATWSEEKILTGTLATIADQTKASGIEKTALIIIGRVITETGVPSKLYDAGFSHEYRTGRKE